MWCEQNSAQFPLWLKRQMISRKKKILSSGMLYLWNTAIFDTFFQVYFHSLIWILGMVHSYTCSHSFNVWSLLLIPNFVDGIQKPTLPSCCSLFFRHLECFDENFTSIQFVFSFTIIIDFESLFHILVLTWLRWDDYQSNNLKWQKKPKRLGKNSNFGQIFFTKTEVLDFWPP